MNNKYLTPDEIKWRKGMAKLKRHVAIFFPLCAILYLGGLASIGALIYTFLFERDYNGWVLIYRGLIAIPIAFSLGTYCLKRAVITVENIRTLKGIYGEDGNALSIAINKVNS